jgi:hypothetical protein
VTFASAVAAKTKADDFRFPGKSAQQAALEYGNANVLCTPPFTASAPAFRDWAGNVSNFPREITETALAHVIGDKAEQAYRRSDVLDKRRKLMEAWAAYCEPKASTNVVQIRKR